MGPFSEGQPVRRVNYGPKGTEWLQRGEMTSDQIFWRYVTANGLERGNSFSRGKKGSVVGKVGCKRPKVSTEVQEEKNAKLLYPSERGNARRNAWGEQRFDLKQRTADRQLWSPSKIRGLKEPREGSVGQGAGGRVVQLLISQTVPFTEVPGRW